MSFTTKSESVGNFFAPFFDVVFYSPGNAEGLKITNIDDYGSISSIGAGAIARKSTSGQSTVFSPDKSAEGLRNFRSSLIIESRASTSVKATLTLQPPYDHAVGIIDSEVLTFGSLMEIEWGYMSSNGREAQISNLGLFTITQPSVKFGQEISIELTGWDLIYMSSDSIDRRCLWPRETYATDVDIIKKLASHINKDYKVDTSQISSESSILKDKEGQHIIQTCTDFSFLRQLITDNDCEYRIEGDKLSIFDTNSLDTQSPSFRLLWYRQPTENTDIPMISFNTNSIPSLFAARGTRGVSHIVSDPDEITTDRDPKEKAEGESPVGGQEPESSKREGPQKGKDSAPDESRHSKTKADTRSGQFAPYVWPDPSCASGIVQIIPKDTPNRKEQTIRRQRDSVRRANTHASAVIPGHPGIKPLSVVNVWGQEGAGVGEKFAGNYRILNVVHELGQGYTTKLDMLRIPIKNKSITNQKPVDKQGGNSVTNPSPQENSSFNLDKGKF